MTPPKRILVIDDDPVVVKMLDSLLKSHQYEVLLAADAPTGLEMAMKCSPHLIILDVMMPIINGYNICRLLKKETKHSKIPIILLTSRASEEDHRIGKEVGADAYINKPLNTTELLSQIQGMLVA